MTPTYLGQRDEAEQLQEERRPGPRGRHLRAPPLRTAKTMSAVPGELEELSGEVAGTCAGLVRGWCGA